MGERQDDRGAADGRRRCVHPGATASGAPTLGDGAGLEELLAVVLRAPGTGPAGGSDGEQRAVAAFRAARDAGVHRTRTRRRDDWREQGQRRTARSLRATLSVAVASLALGGVAVAAIGTVGSSADHASGGARPTARPSAPAAASAGHTTADPADPASAPVLPARPATAQDTAAKCRAYEKAGGKGGKAMEATAWQRLVDAAGGEDQVTAYCAHVTATASPPGRTTRGNTTPGTARATARPDGAGGSPGAAASNATQGKGQDGGQGNGRTDGQTEGQADGQSNGGKTGGGKGS
ncbi:hypothetical protein ABZX38_04630 [Streptomyces longwoodensis]|uniref:hypothetical protein n=1 Tax=Streptomyces longwoodensis TaxID=68231 RepID=UPI0033AE9989